MISTNKRILIVDDEPMVREIANEYLGSMGYEVTEAEDGSVGVELFEAAINDGAPFAMVVMDLTLPGALNGKDAMARMVEQDPEIRGVVSSGDSSNPVMVDYKQYNFTAAIAKPYILSDLKALVESLIG